MVALNRRIFLAAGALGVGGMLRPAFAATPVFFHNEGCTCCHGWAAHMAKAGLAVELQASPDLSAEYRRHGVAAQYETCHVGRIDGYVISGHVPVADIQRLLVEKPKALGLAVPGMPTGSPGMEYGGQTEPYAVLLLQADGSASEFTRYG